MIRLKRTVLAALMFVMALIVLTQPVKAPSHEEHIYTVNLTADGIVDDVVGEGAEDEVLAPTEETGKDEVVAPTEETGKDEVVEEGNALVDEAVALIDSIYTWVMIAVATIGLPALILFGTKLAAAIKSLVGKQTDGNVASKELIRIFKHMYATEQEQAKALTAIIVMSNFDALKKEKLLNDIADPTISFAEMRDEAIDTITDNATATAVLKSVFEQDE